MLTENDLLDLKKRIVKIHEGEEFTDEDYFQRCSNLIEEYSEKLKEVKWDDVSFTTFSICDSSMLDYEITFEGDLYIREENLLEKSDHTGKIEFHTLLPNGDVDLELTFRALFFKGELKEFGLDRCKEIDPEPRKKAQQEVMAAVKRQENLKKSWWFKIITQYRGDPLNGFSRY